MILSRTQLWVSVRGGKALLFLLLLLGSATHHGHPASARSARRNPKRKGGGGGGRGAAGGGGGGTEWVPVQKPLRAVLSTLRATVDIEAAAADPALALELLAASDGGPCRPASATGGGSGSSRAQECGKLVGELVQLAALANQAKVCVDQGSFRGTFSLRLPAENVPVLRPGPDRKTGWCSR